MNKSQIHQCLLASWATYEFKDGPDTPSLELLEIVTNKFTDTECYVYKDNKHDSILIGFRGTKGLKDLFTSINVSKQKVHQTDGAYYIHKGFWDAWFSIEERISNLAFEYTKHKHNIIFTGHSLGGALATIAALRLSYLYPSVVTFGSPKVGDRKFRKQFNDRIPNSVRIILDDDFIPGILGFGYKHVKTLVHLDENGKQIKYNFWRKLANLFRFKKSRAMDFNDHQLTSYNDIIIKWMDN